jgi:hypothetical protein
MGSAPKHRAPQLLNQAPHIPRDVPSMHQQVYAVRELGTTLRRYSPGLAELDRMCHRLVVLQPVEGHARSREDSRPTSTAPVQPFLPPPRDPSATLRAIGRSSQGSRCRCVGTALSTSDSVSLLSLTACSQFGALRQGCWESFSQQCRGATFLV